VIGQNPAEHSSYLKSLTFHVLHGTFQTNVLPKLRLLSLRMWCQVEDYGTTAQCDSPEYRNLTYNYGVNIYLYFTFSAFLWEGQELLFNCCQGCSPSISVCYERKEAEEARYGCCGY